MDSEALCLSCGMCCNGAMYGHIVLTPQDGPVLDALGIEPEDGAGAAPTLPQPCCFLDGKRCTIYARRFASCRAFECATLSAVTAVEIAPEEAARRVALAEAALDAVREALPEGEDLAYARARRARAVGGGKITPEDARLSVLLTALDRVLDRYFRFPGDRVIDRQPGRENL